MVQTDIIVKDMRTTAVIVSLTIGLQGIPLTSRQPLDDVIYQIWQTMHDGQSPVTKACCKHIILRGAKTDQKVY